MLYPNIPTSKPEGKSPKQLKPECDRFSQKMLISHTFVIATCRASLVTVVVRHAAHLAGIWGAAGHGACGGAQRCEDLEDTRQVVQP